ncbi:Sugar transporter, putative isoform 1 [Hibiscus syriacus]|uniref:Sugar transporter, putative isoform 1 n=1 Tax=Hibiscus syriacus TaxID=106335 RepID=A0A6A2XDS5_HIBSY|nr:Sugar transporter, putative isoform 1 [Hibiscus syriacus]
MMIMKLCPNLDNEEGLDTVLEVPIPIEMYIKMGSNEVLRWQNLRNFMKAHSSLDTSTYFLANSHNEFLTLLKIVGAPLIPSRVDLDNYTLSTPINGGFHCKIYNATICGRLWRAFGIEFHKNIYAVGKVQMQGSEMLLGDEMMNDIDDFEFGGRLPKPVMRIEALLDLYDDSHRCTASLFINALSVGEQAVDNEDCFILMLETDSEALKPKNRLLTKFEDKKLLRMKTAISNDSVFWETSVESVVQDYRYVDGINIAHSGKTITTLYRIGKMHKHKRRIEESWWIDEVEFNIHGLSNETFLPPADLKREHDEN